MLPPLADPVMARHEQLIQLIRALTDPSMTLAEALARWKSINARLDAPRQEQDNA